ncbi:MAG: hypothetical protein N3G75_07640 [Methanothrix sp.]|nr:hypothetical protein [Methanothrix sp.]MCX8207686.1 hypothetical protein [Methanothrix sp.]
MSKTFWVNLIALIAMVVQSVNGFTISPEEQAAILAVINIVLRFYTHDEIKL